MKNYRFLITKHARERFVERFTRESRQFAHLSRCRGCEICKELAFKLYELVETNKANWDKIICAKLHDAEDVKIFHNNSIFMDNMYAKYGYGRFRFLVEGIILFPVSVEGCTNVVLTCMNVNNPTNGSMVIADFVNRPKYKKLLI